MRRVRDHTEVRHHTDIDAAPERVWEILTDFPSFPSWNPFIVTLEGDLAPGGYLRVTLRFGRRLMRFHPEVTVVRPAREIRWLARQRVPGIFDVERAFELEPLGASRTRFGQWEVGRGLLAPVVMAIMGREIAHGYVALGQALKARAEAQVGARP